ncbi:MAG: hypothetical protein ACTSRC_02960 [Candidatus Helarchaeota archaeon]
MNLKEYGLRNLLSILGLSDDYRPYIKGQDETLELIARYLKGDLIEKTTKEPLTPKVNVLINEIEKNIRQKLQDTIPYVKKWYWPNWKEYALCITHDVDKISETKKHIWRIRNRFSKFTVLKALLGISNPYNNLKHYANLEKQHNVTSSFYFLVDAYDIQKISKDIKRIQTLQSEIGLHGGFGTHNNINQLQSEKEKLETIIKAPIHGNRYHFLKIEFPTSWEVLNEANFLYDTTIGFNDRIGFKMGVASPFFTVDHELKPLPIIEIPLIIMDAAIWSGLKLTEKTALSKILQVRDIVKTHHGLFTLLWHQCTLKMRGGRLYKEILNALIDDAAHIANGIEIANWWIARDEFQVKIISKSDVVLLKLENPRKIMNLGLNINATQMKIISKSPNLRVITEADNEYKLTFISGETGEIKLKKC